MNKLICTLDPFWQVPYYIILFIIGYRKRQDPVLRIWSPCTCSMNIPLLLEIGAV